MRDTLLSLKKVRGIETRTARLAFAEAERARAAVEEELNSLLASVAASHSGDDEGYMGGDAHWLAAEQAWRLRMQVRIRGTRQTLHAHTARVAQQRDALVEANRQERVVETAIEKLDRELALERKRKDAKKLDEIATNGWLRGGGQ